MILYQDCSSHLDLSKNMAVRGWVLFSLYICIENIKNLLVRNHWTDFHMILQKCSFGYPVARLFKPFGFVKNHGRQGGRDLFSLYIYIENFKNLLVIKHWTDSSKNMAARGRGLFSLYIYIEKFKNLLVRNHWTDFNIILQKCPLGDPVPRLFKPFGFVKKHGRQGVGLIFTIYLYRKH